MTKIDIRAASKADALHVAQNMTARHMAETTALSALGPAEIVPALAERFGGGVCATVDGEPVAVGEVFTGRPNVASLGLLTTDRFTRAAPEFTRFLRDELFKDLRSYGVHRIECVTMAEFTAAHRWMERLGLSKEADLRKYGRNGEDFVQFSWVA